MALRGTMDTTLRMASRSTKGWVGTSVEALLEHAARGVTRPPSSNHGHSGSFGHLTGAESIISKRRPCQSNGNPRSHVPHAKRCYFGDLPAAIERLTKLGAQVMRRRGHHYARCRGFPSSSARSADGPPAPAPATVCIALRRNASPRSPRVTHATRGDHNDLPLADEKERRAAPLLNRCLRLTTTRARRSRRPGCAGRAYLGAIACDRSCCARRGGRTASC